jgi:hypothetical protein
MPARQHNRKVTGHAKAKIFVQIQHARGEKGSVRRTFLFFFLSFAGPLLAGLEWETTFREMDPKPGEKVYTATFPFRNPTSEIIKITGIQTSCGCTSAKADIKEIPPGGSGSVQVRFDAGNRTGEQVKMAIVRTSDKEKHNLILRVILPHR